MIETQVLVVGAGPVGLTLALDLAQRGVKVLLVEKNETPLRLPKMERSNPRTMEIYRRLGLVDRIRSAGYPADAPMDVLIVNSLAEAPLLRQVYPSVAETRQRIADCKDGSLPREPYQLVSQYTLEPLLLAEAKQTAGLTVLQSTEFLQLSQDDEGVDATLLQRDGSTQNVRCDYLVGCDGGGGTVRKQIDVALEGRSQLGTITNIFFRCEDLLEKSHVGLARHYGIARVGPAGGAAGVIVTQDDTKHFAFHTPVPDGYDPVELLREVTGLDIQPEILHAGPWTQHIVVAERHSVGRVFLAGDANHLYIPAGGLGMNTGIGDAANLAWKLAATLAGWGGPALLESYGVERSSVARRNSEAVTWALEGVFTWRGAYTELVHEDTAAGRAAREEFIRIADAGNRRVYEMHGADLGYRYQSAIISDAEGPPPSSPIQAYEPSTWPGAHLPHVWLSANDALYDRLNTRGYTLLSLASGNPDVAPLEAAIRATGAPLQVLRVSDERIREIFERDFLLLRPDLHVAWRADELPTDPVPLAATITGFAAA